MPNHTINFNTADLIDDFAAELQSCSTQFKNMGGIKKFYGQITTVKCKNDNALLKSILSNPSNGGVLVVDGYGNMQSALMGDVIAGRAIKNGWSGVVINGPIRDLVAISGMKIGVKALGSNPAKSNKDGIGDKNITINFGDVTFNPQNWVYCDADGIVIAKRPLL